MVLSGRKQFWFWTKHLLYSWKGCWWFHYWYKARFLIPSWEINLIDAFQKRNTFSALAEYNMAFSQKLPSFATFQREHTLQDHHTLRETQEKTFLLRHNLYSQQLLVSIYPHGSAVASKYILLSIASITQQSLNSAK